MKKFYWKWLFILLAGLMTGAVRPAKAVVADHTSVGLFGQLTAAQISRAAGYKTLFMHQSTGGIIADSGLGCLAGLHGEAADYPNECVIWADHRNAGSGMWYDKSKWDWDYWPSSQSDAMAKTDQWVSVAKARANSYQVLGMKYCYVDGWNQSENVESSYYIQKMEELEKLYPSKIFVWATSALWNSPGSACGGNFDSCAEIADFNQQVRTYAKAHNKPLYDIADIESDGGTCKVGGYEGLCGKYYANSGGHPNPEGAIRLAKSFWWLMANLEDTNTTVVQVEGDANGDGKVDLSDYLVWYSEFTTSKSANLQADFNSDNKTDLSDYLEWYTEFTK